MFVQHAEDDALAGARFLRRLGERAPPTGARVIDLGGNLLREDAPEADDLIVSADRMFVPYSSRGMR